MCHCVCGRDGGKGFFPSLGEAIKAARRARGILFDKEDAITTRLRGLRIRLCWSPRCDLAFDCGAVLVGN